MNFGVLMQLEGLALTGHRRNGKLHFQPGKCSYFQHFSIFQLGFFANENEGNAAEGFANVPWRT